MYFYNISGGKYFPLLLKITLNAVTDDSYVNEEI